MSGIFGVFDRSGHLVTKRELRIMGEAMIHWGCHDCSIWLGGATGLGHLLHEDTPEAALERQPVKDPEAPHLTLIADARIDNRETLGASLDIPLRDQPHLPDSVFILRA